ncbi:MAG TPA: ferrous iron transport protein B [Polyangiaceae bacterium]|nr:ferrous iron transport protein B [Polyangiaceae bacterium]
MSAAASAEQAPAPAPGESGGQRTPLVLVVGNPNVGKTTLFNRLTGENARIGNYPGVTVERRSGKLSGRRGNEGVEIVDVPGAYSLSARSAEEQIALSAILGLNDNPTPDLCVLVVDAGQLARNLYLAVQLCELSVPLVIALNMIDEVAENPPDARELGRLLGVPCVATDGRRGTGLAELSQAIQGALQERPRARVHVGYERELVALADRLADALPRSWRGSVERDRALAFWALTSVEEDDELEGVPAELRERCAEIRRQASERDLDHDIIAARYAFIDQKLPLLFDQPNPHPPKRKLSERADRVLLHPVSGLLAFVLLMFVVFQALFSWSEPMIGAIEDVFAALSGFVSGAFPDGKLRDLVTEGVIGGVGNVVVFLPQILLLFFFIGLLEDSGYMARVAYLMDRVMKALGLHGRAFVPMLSGFACAVPAILATRTMERQRDRLLTMMVVPLTTCSARLPVYTLVIAALFPTTLLFGFLPLQGLIMIGLYLLSLGLTLLVAGVLGRTVIKGKRIPLILELPPYRLPSLRVTAKLMLERAGVFLKEAGTVILVCTIALWALLSFSPSTPPAPVASKDQTVQTASPSAIEQSYGGRLGKAIEPVIEPLGFDWRLGIGLIGAFAAREVFVSTLGLVYGMDDLDDEAAPLREKLGAKADGKPVYTPLAGLSLLVFFAIACQCMSTLAVVKRETKSWRWPAFLFGYTLVLAYGSSLLIYQGGKALGFG